MWLTLALFLFFSSSFYLFPILMWAWLRPNKLPKPRKDDENGGDPFAGIPLIPLPPESPGSDWFTDRRVENQKVRSF